MPRPACTPANDYGGNEDCTQMYGSNGAWNDSPCGDKSNFICALP